MNFKLFALLLAIAPCLASGQETREVGLVEPEAQQIDKNDPANASSESPLKQLGWMVGRWIDRGEGATITTQCDWSHEGRFFTRKFEISAEGEASLKGTQIIGWDPIEGQLRSWTFDSAGGFGSGRWIKDENRWLVKTSFVLASGERASAINIITFLDNDAFLWQSTNREIAGEIQPNIPEVKVVRLADAGADATRDHEGESE
ncbi:hypothetical protein SH139x_003179 [Planctomycetaceae bacterium SH139]